MSNRDQLKEKIKEKAGEKLQEKLGDVRIGCLHGGQTANYTGRTPKMISNSCPIAEPLARNLTRFLDFFVSDVCGL